MMRYPWSTALPETIMNSTVPFTRRTLRAPKVADKLDVSESSVWRIARLPGFPQPIKLSRGCTGWYEHEIDQWIDAKAKARKCDHLPANAGLPRSEVEGVS
jgi:prophage regulatory protein